VFGWALVMFIGIITFYNRFNMFPISQDYYMRMAFNIVVFYLNFSLFVPKLLLNKKIVLYLVVSFTIILFLLYIYKNLLPEGYFKPELIKRRRVFEVIPSRGRGFRGLVHFITIFLLFAVGTSVKLVVEWYKNEKLKSLIKTEKINTELSFLKAQLNPHFLFNSLNSIYSLANKKSDNTTNAIVTLSELMRYMIYEADKEFVNLQNEINYIKNYISLQTLRIKDSSGVRFNVHGNLDHNIEPLLLISFIENAFKYGTDYTGKTNINIKISVEENQLLLKICNYISLKEKNNQHSGIGIQNIKQRLKLLYPNSHSLKIEEVDSLFTVELLLKLKKI
jgi:two-component system, LytTR family, sensor kinase